MIAQSTNAGSDAPLLDDLSTVGNLKPSPSPRGSLTEVSVSAWLRASDPVIAPRAVPDTGRASGVAEMLLEARRIILAQAEELQRLHRLSLLDGLTELYNWRGFVAQFAMALDESRRTGRGGVLVYVDLNDFKMINDELGHTAGNAVLCNVASYLRNRVRRHDSVARLGGDEFAVLLTRIHPIRGVRRARELAEGVNQLRVPFEGREIPVQASVGAVPFGPLDSEAELLARADREMYRAKRGRSYVAGIGGYRTRARR